MRIEACAMLGVKTGLSLDRPERADETGLAHAGDTVDPCRRTQRGVQNLVRSLNGGSTDCGAVPAESLAQAAARAALMHAARREAAYRA